MEGARGVSKWLAGGGGVPSFFSLFFVADAFLTGILHFPAVGEEVFRTY